MKIKAKEEVLTFTDDSEPVFDTNFDPIDDKYGPVEETVDIPVEESATEPVVTEKKRTTSKLIVWACLINGFLWVWCSYILAALDKVQIAESLSQVAVTEIIGVVLAYCIKSAVENLSKNNHWPDKSGKDPPGVG